MYITAVLQDRTLDLAREHNRMMLQLRERAYALEEQREKEFAHIMSTDFVQGLNEKASASQQEMIRSFNEKGTAIWKKAIMGRIPVQDRIELQKAATELQTFQGNLRSTLQTLDQARSIVAKDGGNRFDTDASLKKIREWESGWDGKKTVALPDLLEASYLNIGDAYSRFVRTFEADEGRIRETVITNEGRRVQTDRDVWVRGGADSREKAIRNSLSFIREGNVFRSIEAFYQETPEDIRGRIDEVAGSLQGMKLPPLREGEAEHYLSEREAKGIATLELSRGVPIEEEWVRRRTTDGTAPVLTSRRAGGTRAITGSQRVKVPPQMQNRVMTHTFNVGHEPIINMPSKIIEKGGVLFADENIRLTVRHITVDGDVIGTYTGALSRMNIQEKALLSVDDGTLAKIPENQRLAFALRYYDSQGVKADRVVLKNGVYVPYSARTTEEQTVRVSMEDVQEELRATLSGFDTWWRNFSSRREKKDDRTKLLESFGATPAN